MNVAEPAELLADALGDAAMLKLIASSISVMVTVSDTLPIEAVPSAIVWLLSVATIVSLPSISSSLTAATVNTIGLPL